MQVLVGVAVAVIVGILVWLGRPIRGRLDTSGVRVRNDHGLRATLVRDPTDLVALSPEVSLGLRPEWLDGVTFYFLHGKPAADPPAGDLGLWPAWGRAEGGEDVYFTHALVLNQATQDRSVVLRPPTIHRFASP